MRLRLIFGFLIFLCATMAHAQTATVNFSTTYQVVDGFGASSIFLQGNTNLSTIIFPETSGSSDLAGMANTTLTDGSAAPYVGTVATHDYGTSEVATVVPCPPTGTLPCWETEVSDFNTFDASITSGLVYAKEIHDWFSGSNLTAWNFWWLVGLNGDNEGLMDNSSAVVAKRTYTLGNWAKFVRPGWLRVSATANPQSGVYITAFKHPTNGQFVVVAINQNGSGTSQTISGLTGVTTLTPYVTNSTFNLAAQSAVSVSSGSVTYTLPADSVTTFSGGIPTGPYNVYFSQSGAGGTTGADCADALPASYFNNSANWSSTPTSPQLGPGVTAHACGTFTGSANAGGILAVQGNGASGSPVTIVFESGAQITAPYCNWEANGTGCLFISSPSNPHSYITLDGGVNHPCGWTWASGSEGSCNGSIVNTDSGTGLTTNTSTTAIEMENCNTCEVRNLSIANIYVQSGGDTNANPQDENCIAFSGTNISIHDNQFHDVGWCLWYIEKNGDSNLKVYNNDIYNTPHPTNFSGGSSGTASGAYWYSNHFHDFENWNTSSCTYHVEGFHSDGTGAVFDNLYIYNNYFGPGSGACLFANVFWSAATDMVFNSAAFNNVIFNDNSTANEYGMAITGAGNALYNNTLIGQNTTGAYGINWAGYTGSQALTIKNNAQQGMYTFLLDDDTGSEGTGITADYNVYSNSSPAHGSCFQAFYSGGTCNWTQYLSNTINGGQEQHSTNTGLLSGGYCCSGTLNLNATTYVPNTGSAVIAAGTNLTSLCSGGLAPLCFDALGRARPTTGPWDVGAIQYGGVPVNPVPTGKLPLFTYHSWRNNEKDSWHCDTCSFSLWMSEHAGSRHAPSAGADTSGLHN
jgi:hypothetical protein